MKVDIDTSDKLYADAWLGFKGTDWKNEINVRDFIQHNYTPYEGDESFLAEATPATTELWEKSWKASVSKMRLTRHWISIPILPLQLPLMMQDILTSRWKNSGSANGCAIKACAASVRRH